MKKIIVGMSGGVDSAVSALLLKNQGFEVTGLFMKNWEETDPHGVCKASKEYEDVIACCETIGIPYYSVNFTERYKTHVFAQFLADCKAGLTPNPDLLCNREIKFKFFLEKALQLGEGLATGHYCQVDGQNRLLKGADPHKDQSYFLASIQKGSLKNVLFPVGSLLKKQVREIARKARLPVFEKKDSTGICFIGKRDFKPFLSQYIGTKKGVLQRLNGEVVGTHDGVAFYTIGQRKGLGLSGEGEAWFVVGKDIEKNVVFVEQGANHPALFTTELVARDLNWLDDPPNEFPFSCTAKIRYRQTDQACKVMSLENGKVRVVFQHPQRAVTAGQAAVFYNNKVCLGSGVIE